MAFRRVVWSNQVLGQPPWSSSGSPVNWQNVTSLVRLQTTRESDLRSCYSTASTGIQGYLSRLNAARRWLVVMVGRCLYVMCWSDAAIIGCSATSFVECCWPYFSIALACATWFGNEYGCNDSHVSKHYCRCGWRKLSQICSSEIKPITPLFFIFFKQIRQPHCEVHYPNPVSAILKVSDAVSLMMFDLFEWVQIVPWNSGTMQLELLI